jgi:hypothetical protein
MKKALWPALAGVVLLVTVIYGWYYFPRGGRPSPERLQQLALTAATPQEQQAAAAQLCDWGEAAKPQMRSVLESSKEPAIKAMMIQRLGAMFDYDSMDLLLAGLSDESVMVRERSMLVVRNMLGRSVPFDPNAPEAQRAKAVEWMRKEWDQLKASPVLAGFKERQQRGENVPPSATKP